MSTPRILDVLKAYLSFAMNGTYTVEASAEAPDEGLSGTLRSEPISGTLNVVTGEDGRVYKFVRKE